MVVQGRGLPMNVVLGWPKAGGGPTTSLAKPRLGAAARCLQRQMTMDPRKQKRHKKRHRHNVGRIFLTFC